MIKYHGTPITPNWCIERVSPNNFCVSFFRPDQATWCLKHGQSVLWDNGAFSAHTKGIGVDSDYWGRYYTWLEPRLFHPHWAIVPDTIAGGVSANRLLEFLWPYPPELSGVVYHLSEPLDRLRELLDNWPRICLGGSVGTCNPGADGWRRQIDACWGVIARSPGRPWIHMLRALKAASAGPWPFASADSASFARHHNEYRETQFKRLHEINKRNPNEITSRL